MKDTKVYIINKHDKDDAYLYGWTTIKEHAKMFMDIHNKSMFECGTIKLCDNDFDCFHNENTSKEISVVETLGSNGEKIYIPMTNAEEQEVDDVFYTTLFDECSDALHGMPTCKVFKKKYHMALDLLAIAYYSELSFVESMSYADDLFTAIYDNESYGFGPLGNRMASATPSRIHIYMSLYMDQLDVKKGKKGR